MMTLGDDFLKCALETIDELALLYAGTPNEEVEASLAGFAARMRAGWRETFDFLRGEDVDGMAADLVDRIRKKRREMEAVRAGKG
jgi:hypothetical protein